MKTNADYTTNFKVANTDYGQITVPKGTPVTHMTASGVDKNYHFVNSFDWIKPHSDGTPQHGLIMDMQNYGLNIPTNYIDYENS